jgi:type IV pilus assembly protein PilA
MTRKHQHARDKQAGFSFVELLVAMVVLALLAALAIPAFAGQREKAGDAAAKSLLRSGASTIETAAVGEDGYTALDAAALGAIETNIAWRDTPGAKTADDEISISGTSAGGYTLSSTSSTGRMFTLTKDVSNQPTVTRTCGAGCTW